VPRGSHDLEKPAPLSEIRNDREECSRPAAVCELNAIPLPLEPVFPTCKLTRRSEPPEGASENPSFRQRLTVSTQFHPSSALKAAARRRELRLRR